MTRILLLLALPGLLAAPLAAVPATADEEVGVTSLTPPTVVGEARYRERLSATPGTWSPGDVTLAYQWLRDGAPVAGATGTTYRLQLEDLGTRVSVAVTASSGDLTPATATSAPTATVGKARFERTSKPRIVGAVRFDRVVEARAADLSPAPERTRYRWLRNGEPIPGATRRTYRVDVADVGKALSVEQVSRREGFEVATPTSKRVTAEHRVAARRTVTYVVRTRGSVTANLATFKKLAQRTLEDPRGWRGAGVAFKRVKKGGAFTLWLSQASALPGFGYPCSPMWSCRSGDNVIINQDRWQNASPMWNAIGRSLRDYRHMVVNHEVGHWLGHGHRYCGGAGQLAPLMMQQSKGLNGCRANPWPLPSERFLPRF